MASEFVCTTKWIMVETYPIWDNLEKLKYSYFDSSEQCTGLRNLSLSYNGWCSTLLNFSHSCLEPIQVNPHRQPEEDESQLIILIAMIDISRHISHWKCYVYVILLLEFLTSWERWDRSRSWLMQLELHLWWHSILLHQVQRDLDSYLQWLISHHQ